MADLHPQFPPFGGIELPANPRIFMKLWKAVWEVILAAIIYLEIAFYCLLFLVLTWVSVTIANRRDAPAASTTLDRILSAVPATIILALMGFSLVLIWRRARKP